MVIELHEELLPSLCCDLDETLVNCKHSAVVALHTHSVALCLLTSNVQFCSEWCCGPSVKPWGSALNYGPHRNIVLLVCTT